MLARMVLHNVSVAKLIASVESNKKIAVVNTALSYNFLIGILMSLFILLCEPLIIFIFKSKQLTQLLIYIPLLFFLNSFYELLLHILQGFHKYKIIAISQIINGMVKLILIVLFLGILKMGIIGLIYAFYLSFLIPILCQYISVPVKKQFNFNYRLFKEIFKFGFPLGLNSVLTFIFTKIDRFIIGSIINPIGVAYYEIASKIPDNCYRMYQSFQSVFLPNMSELFAKKQYKEAEAVLNNSLRLVSFIAIFVSFLTILFKEDIVSIMFSEKYIESAPVLSLLMLSLSIGLVEYILGTTLIAFGQSDKPVKINIVNAVINIVGNLIMIPIFGFIGAAYAVLLARVATNPVYIFFIRRNGINVTIGNYLKPILIFVACYILSLTFNYSGYAFKILLMILLLTFSVSLSIITRRDLLNVIQGVKSHL